MGESFNTVQDLEAPLSLVDERVIFIPRQRRLEVQNFDFKFIFSLDGEADVQIDGRPLGRLRRGDVLIVPRTCKQTYIPTTREELRLHVLRIYFDLSPNSGSLAHTLPANSEPLELRDFLRTHFQQVLLFTPQVGSGIHEWTRRIQAESEQRAPGHAVAISAYCRLIVTELARRAVPATPALPLAESASAVIPSSSWMMEHVKQYLFDNYARALSLDDIAREVRLSNEHLCRRFKEHTGQTVFSYVRQLRIEAAKAFLISSKLSVTQIAHRTGFSSVTLFCRTFKRAVEMAPVAYRRRRVSRISFETTSLEPANQMERRLG